MIEIEKALNICNPLLNRTHKVSKGLNSDRAIFYSDFINRMDRWKNAGFLQFLQKGNNSDEKTNDAFLKAFIMRYDNVAIIGSDCLDLTESIIAETFRILNDNEVVLGPAKDDGYYLPGMKMFYPSLCKNKRWSTKSILLDTLSDLPDSNVSFKLLPTLSGIDEEKDLLAYKTLV